MNSPDASGKGPIYTLLHLAKEKVWKPHPPADRDHADATGEKGGSVDAPAAASSAPQAASYTEPERKFMLELARHTLEHVVTDRGELPKVSANDVAPKLAEKKACFVTLTKNGALRGCVGSVQPQEPLCQAIASSARNAALSDPRFPPVAADEVASIRIEISVLTGLQPLSFRSPEDLLSQLQPREHGVVLNLGAHMATFLPQVWDHVADQTDFLNHLAEKAGCTASAWRGKDAAVSVYRVESFHEN